MTRDELKEIIKECIYELNTTIENVSYVITKEDCWYLDELASIDESVLNESVSISGIKDKLLGIIRWFIGKIKEFVNNVKSAISRLTKKDSVSAKFKGTEDKCNSAVDDLKDISKKVVRLSDDDVDEIKSSLKGFTHVANEVKGVSITFANDKGETETINLADREFRNKFDSFMSNKNGHLKFA